VCVCNYYLTTILTVSVCLLQSLVILDQETTPTKLTSANSVNSIVNHVAADIDAQKSEVGRVPGWAVNFDKLLHDTVGILVFKVTRQLQIYNYIYF